MTPNQYLELKGVKKPFQLKRRINLSNAEIIEFLKEYSELKINEVKSKMNAKLKKCIDEII